jgi:putative transposase
MPILEALMWTPEDRALVGNYGSGQALSEDQYRLIEPFIPPPKPGGRPRTTDMRQMVDGLFYVVRTGCQWRHLPPPPAFPPWQTVYGYFRTFLQAGVWETIRHYLVMTLRETEGREASPTAVIIDTQSVKTTEKGALAATMPPRRSRAASAISGSIPPASCSVSSSTPPIFRMLTALGIC